MTRKLQAISVFAKRRKTAVCVDGNSNSNNPSLSGFGSGVTLAKATMDYERG